MRKIQILESPNGARIQLKDEEAYPLSPKALLQMELTQGRPPARQDALEVKLSCQDPSGKTFHQSYKGPWVTHLELRRLVPREFLHPSYVDHQLHCHLDIALVDDWGHRNYESAIPTKISNLFEGGGLSILEKESSLAVEKGLALSILPGNLSQYELSRKSVDGDLWHLVCDQLTPWHGEVSTFNPTLNEFIEGFYEHTKDQPSRHQEVLCRLFVQNSKTQEDLWTEVFSLFRKAQELEVNLRVGHTAHPFTLDMDVSIYNPNPFSLDLFFTDGIIFNQIHLTSRSYRSTSKQPILDFFKMENIRSRWQVEPEDAELSAQVETAERSQSFKGHLRSLRANSSTVLKSRNGPRDRQCPALTHQGFPQLGKSLLEMDLEFREKLPIYTALTPNQNPQILLETPRRIPSPLSLREHRTYHRARSSRDSGPGLHPTLLSSWLEVHSLPSQGRWTTEQHCKFLN